ncbi:MAG TPA: aldo/keto reductase [Candidatus Pacearchaeota archaeon]|mgnify:CR=1 FL=1|nr:aldo/keto reductase [Candidatus Pacearchaeota archaeon]HOK94335.1 aldo/keto reductase [Candidatus Pacearchaeota archaeon]HPO75286.1 aldo/keto reductase [Candidatus Pacearchaeota archaeon]
MEWYDRVYFGTWRLEEHFEELSREEIKSLLNFALQSGIFRFHTAAAYGEGRIEEILGNYLPKEAIIVTKIPTIHQIFPSKNPSIQYFYTPELIRKRTENSLKRLKRDYIYAILLHGWRPYWSAKNSIVVLEALNELREKGLAVKVGVSLPNDFNELIDDETLQYFDIIEAPLNRYQGWILKQLPDLLFFQKEVLLRNLFCQENLLIKYREIPQQVLKEVFSLDTSIVLEIITKQQIIENINYLTKKEDERTWLEKLYS